MVSLPAVMLNWVQAATALSNQQFPSRRESGDLTNQGSVGLLLWFPGSATENLYYPVSLPFDSGFFAPPCAPLQKLPRDSLVVTAGMKE